MSDLLLIPEEGTDTKFIVTEKIHGKIVKILIYTDLIEILDEHKNPVDFCGVQQFFSDERWTVIFNNLRSNLLNNKYEFVILTGVYFGGSNNSRVKWWLDDKSKIPCDYSASNQFLVFNITSNVINGHSVVNDIKWEIKERRFFSRMGNWYKIFSRRTEMKCFSWDELEYICDIARLDTVPVIKKCDSYQDLVNFLDNNKNTNLVDSDGVICHPSISIPSQVFTPREERRSCGEGHLFSMHKINGLVIRYENSVSSEKVHVPFTYEEIAYSSDDNGLEKKLQELSL